MMIDNKRNSQQFNNGENVYQKRNKQKPGIPCSAEIAAQQQKSPAMLHDLTFNNIK